MTWDSCRGGMTTGRLAMRILKLMIRVKMNKVMLNKVMLLMSLA